MRNHVVTWHNLSLNPVSRTLILINHPVRSLDTPEEGIHRSLTTYLPGCRLFPIVFSIYVNKVDDPWEKRLLSVAVLRGPSVNGRGTCSKVQWPQIETHVWRGRKKRGRERSLEGLMISRERSHRIRDEINVATYEIMRVWRISFDSFVERNGISFRGKFRWLVVFAARKRYVIEIVRSFASRLCTRMIYNKIFRSWHHRDQTPYR